MTTNQLFFAIAGLLVAGFGFVKYYIDAKIDPIGSSVQRLVDYMVSHHGKIERLDERVSTLEKK